MWWQMNVKTNCCSTNTWKGSKFQLFSYKTTRITAMWHFVLLHLGHKFFRGGIYSAQRYISLFIVQFIHTLLCGKSCTLHNIHFRSPNTSSHLHWHSRKRRRLLSPRFLAGLFSAYRDLTLQWTNDQQRLTLLQLRIL